MFGRKKESHEATPTAEVVSHPEREGAKNRPTPKRREAQAANRRPIVPNDRKAARKADRARMREQRERERVALATGDDRYLPARDAGPVRRYVRDLVDARFNLGELYLPAMLLLLFGIFLPPLLTTDPEQRLQWNFYVSFALYGLILLIALDTFMLWRKVKPAVMDRFGQDTPLRGLLAYSFSRSVNLRRWRRPKPAVSRGESPRP